MEIFRLLRFFLLHSMVFYRPNGGVSLDHSMVTAEKVVHTQSEVYTPTHQSDMEENFEDGVSANDDTEYPKMAFSSKPKNRTTVFGTTRAQKGQRLRKDRKNNPCVKREYNGYCVHGVCKYLKELNITSCICPEGYTGERCHLFSLAVGKEDVKVNKTALAVTAAVLSLTCLTIIGILLAVRYYKKEESNVDEKIRLEAATA